MTTTNKILIGVGGITIIGVGIYLITKDSGTTTTTTTTTGGGTIPGGQTDPTTNSVDSLGTTIGNIFQDIWATTQKNKGNTPANCNYTGPADPYEVEVVNEVTSETAIKALQTRVSACSADIKKVIDDSGGVDGILGNGTKTAYNMARKSCCINGPTT
mgnify:FL=1